MRQRGIWTFIFIVFLATQASAELGVKPSQKSGFQIPLTENLQKTDSLLDLSRLSFNHTLGMTYSSTQGGGLSQYYLNEMTYQISKPLVIKAQIGVANNLSSTTKYGSASGVQVIVPNVSILYQPKPNLRIEFGFSNMPNYYGRPNYSPYAPY
jgi:hypothetical protein